MKKLVQFLAGVKGEIKKIQWPSKKDLFTYSIATLSVMLIIGLFFTGLDFAFSFIKTMV